MKKFFIFWALLPVLVGCSDFLDQVPADDILTVESLFEKRATASEWLIDCHQYLQSGVGLGDNVAMCGGDEFVGGTIVRGQLQPFKIAEGRQQAQDPYNNIWSTDWAYYYIRYCNIFLEDIDNVYDMEDLEKKQWSAEIKALKAYIYFDLVKRYGPIVLVPENIAVNAPLDEMKQPRMHVDTCFNAIVDLLDEAMDYLQPVSEKSVSRKAFFSYESALALKARVLLYAASPLFNGNEFYTDFKGKDGEPLFSTTYDPEKWRLAAEAADKAVEVCEANGFKLIQGNNDKGTTLLNTMRDIELSVWAPGWESSEAIFMTKEKANFWSRTLPRYNSGRTDIFVELIRGDIAAPIKMVEMFYTENGLPIEYDKQWNYAGRYQMQRESNEQYRHVVSLSEEVLALHLKREPRFYADIAADRCFFQRGPSLTDDNMLVEARQGELWGIVSDRINTSDYQNLTGYWIKKFSRTDFKPLSYSVDLSALGDTPFPLIRLAELYLIQAEAWNEYEGPTQRVYDAINKVRSRAGIPDVETSWRDSKVPNMVKTKDGMREIIHQEKCIEFAFEGHRFWDLRRWKTAHIELNSKPMGWNIAGSTARQFYNNYDGPVAVGVPYEFKSPRDYLWPIKSEEVLISGYVQNPGW